MKLAITNQDRTKFLTRWQGNFGWTDNPELSCCFKSEEDALEYEEGDACEFLQFGTSVYSYINDISDLIQPLK